MRLCMMTLAVVGLIIGHEVYRLGDLDVSEKAVMHRVMRDSLLGEVKERIDDV